MTRDYYYVGRFWSVGVVLFPRFDWFFGVSVSRFGTGNWVVEFGLGFVKFWIGRDNIEVVS